ncbi:hypothetical protein [Priestia abyssalis]|uniref:hypothetical protein n=1 Tax=Priestia abyssalis TaxID=1221450 RepID=UPI000995128A|nr:hypothetical protein [Priestia abyssalis]
MERWENVARGIGIVIVLNFLSFYFEKRATSFWLESLCVFAIVLSVMFILSKIKFLQKPVSKKVGWLTFTVAFIVITVMFDFVLK